MLFMKPPKLKEWRDIDIVVIKNLEMLAQQTKVARSLTRKRLALLTSKALTLFSR